MEVSMALKHVTGKQMGHIVLYDLSTCPWCQKTKKLLGDIGADYYYEDVDLLVGEEQRNAMSEVSRWNPQRSFPVLVIDDTQAIIGFKETEIREALLK
jgi:glutaredoxin-like protein NrdH